MSHLSLSLINRRSQTKYSLFTNFGYYVSKGSLFRIFRSHVCFSKIVRFGKAESERIAQRLHYITVIKSDFSNTSKLHIYVHVRTC